MKASKHLYSAVLLASALVANISWADDAVLNKKLLRPIGVQNTTSPAVQAAPISANTGADVSLNPQPFPPAESAKLPANSIKPVSALPAPATNRDGSTAKPLLPPLSSELATPAKTLGGDLANSRLDACLGKPCIISVNGKNVGNTTFKPGTRYQIVGKKFGNTRSDVVLNIDGDVAVKLDVTAWRDEEIIAYFKNDFGGKPNSNNVALFIDVPNTPRILPANSQLGKFEALIVKQTIPFGNIPQSAITYEKGAFGEPATDANGYAFYTSTASANQTIDSIKHQFIDKIKLGFINPNFKVLNVNAEFGRTDTNGSRCDRCGAGSGGVYLYGSYGYELKGASELWVSRAVWHNHISPSMNWKPAMWGSLGGPVGTLIGAAAGIDGKKGGNQFASEVIKLELIVEGPKGVNPIK